MKETGLSILLYKDARAGQRILDETFGMFGWKRSHQSIDGNLYCTVEIFDRESGVRVSKQDVGATGYTEKEKYQALEALHDLVEGDFRFTKVVQAERYFTSKNCAYGIDQFVEEWCVPDENGRETMADLYSAYKNFCGLHPEYSRRAINPFSAYLSDKFHLESYNDGESRGKKGIRLLLFEADALTQ